MNFKKLLLLLIMPYTMYSLASSTNNFSKEDSFKKYFEEQQKINIQLQKDLLEEQRKANNAQKEQQDKIIQLLALTLQLEAEKIQNVQRQEAIRQAALKEDSEKGFSFTECGIIIRDTFLEEFNLRTLSTEFCQGLVKTFKRLVLNKAFQETFNGVDYTFGTLLTRHVHPQAGIYPITFLQSNSFSEYTRQRQSFIDKEDPRVRLLNQECDRLLKDADLTQPLVDATTRLQNVGEAILKRGTLHPEDYELKIIAVQREKKSSSNKAEETATNDNSMPSAEQE